MVEIKGIYINFKKIRTIHYEKKLMQKRGFVYYLVVTYFDGEKIIIEIDGKNEYESLAFKIMDAINSNDGE